MINTKATIVGTLAGIAATAAIALGGLTAAEAAAKPCTIAISPGHYAPCAPIIQSAPGTVENEPGSATYVAPDTRPDHSYTHGEFETTEDPDTSEKTTTYSVHSDTGKSYEEAQTAAHGE